MQLRFSIFVCFLVTSIIPAWSQTEKEVVDRINSSSEKELVSINSAFLIEEAFYYADLSADKLLTFNSESANYNYRKAFSLLRVYNDYSKAIPHFEKAVRSINNKYDMFSTTEKSAPSDAFFYLGACYHMNEEIDKAEEFYKKFKASSRKKSALQAKANLHLLQCAEARRLMLSPVNISLSNVGSVVNSQYADYSPVISLDGSALYFTSRRPWPRNISDQLKDKQYNTYTEDVYVSYQDFDQEWSEPLRLKFCNPTRNEATVALSTDERTIYLYMDSTGDGDIYYSNFHNTKFDRIQKLDIKGVNTDYWETHGMISHDQKRFYFVSDRPKGFGGRDIYYCDMMSDGNWSEPMNMGPSINTAYDEDSPFISIDNKTLYFSSNGEKSIGGFDIFMAKQADDNSWSMCQNLGYPFNSTNDDLYYTTTVDGLKGYMTSYRKNGSGEKDIYEINNEFLGIQNISVISGQIVSKEGNQAIDDLVVQVELTCVDCEETAKRVVFPRPRDGFYISGLEPCKSYRIEYKNIDNQKSIYLDSFTTSCDTFYRVVKRDLMLNTDGTLFEVIKMDTLKTLVLNSFLKEVELETKGVILMDEAKNQITTQQDNANATITRIEENKEVAKTETVQAEIDKKQAIADQIREENINKQRQATNTKRDAISKESDEVVAKVEEELTKSDSKNAVVGQAMELAKKETKGLAKPKVAETANSVTKSELKYNKAETGFANPELMQFLGFNKNKLSIEKGDLKKFLDAIHGQLLEGREQVTIQISASASTVPTASFKTNDILAQKRAENIRNDLQTYFDKTSVKNRVKIEIVSAIVQGPAYQGDSSNEAKYGPFQYVGLKTK